MKPDPTPLSVEMLSSMNDLFKLYGVDFKHLTEYVGVSRAQTIYRAMNEVGATVNERLHRVSEILDEWEVCKAHGGVAKNPNIHNFPDGAEIRRVKPDIRELAFTKDELRSILLAAGDTPDKAVDAVWEWLTSKFWIQPQATEFVVQGHKDADTRLNPVIKYVLSTD